MTQRLAVRVQEKGRIRVGARDENSAKGTARRLQHFRLTSDSKYDLELIAKAYGGQVREWPKPPPAWRAPAPTHRFEVFTQADTLKILIHPEGVLTSIFEQRDGRWCNLVCDGQYITYDATGDRKGLGCLCPADPEERRELARQGKACTDRSFIMVLLQGMPFGHWRLTTGGFNGPAEIRGLQEMLRFNYLGDTVLKAQIRLEYRSKQKRVPDPRHPGRFLMEDGHLKVENLTFPVVVIEPEESSDRLLERGEERLALLAGRQLREATKLLPEHVGDLFGDTPEQDPTAPPPPVQPPASGPALQAAQRGYQQIVVKLGERQAQFVDWVEDALGKPLGQWNAEDYGRATVLAAQAVRVQQEQATQRQHEEAEARDVTPGSEADGAQDQRPLFHLDEPEDGDEAPPSGPVTEAADPWRAALMASAKVLQAAVTDRNPPAALRERAEALIFQAIEVCQDPDKTAKDAAAKQRLMDPLITRIRGEA